jgi:hypothetical protein
MDKSTEHISGKVVLTPRPICNDCRLEGLSL